MSNNQIVEKQSDLKQAADPRLKNLPPSGLVTFEQNSPLDPELSKIAGDMLTELKYVLMANAANPAMPVKGRADTVFKQFLGTRKPAVAAVYKKKAADILAAPLPIREATLGRYAKLDIKQYANLGSDGLPKDQMKIDPERLKAAVKKHNEDALKQFSLPPDFFAKLQANEDKKPKLEVNFKGLKDAVDKAEGDKFTKVRLFLKEVHCFEETNELGADVIKVGGTAIDADGKNTRAIEQFVVGGDFDEDETVQFNGDGRLVAEWNISRDEAIGWPKFYYAVLAMCEADDGGFQKFLQKLWALIGEKVTEAISTAVIGGIGAAIGGAVAGIIGAIVGFIVGVIVGWLISLFDNPDDIVQVRQISLALAASTGSYYAWTGLTEGPPKLFTVDFKGDGGHYRTWFHHRISVA